MILIQSSHNKLKVTNSNLQNLKDIIIIIIDESLYVYDTIKRDELVWKMDKWTLHLDKFK